MGIRQLLSLSGGDERALCGRSCCVSSGQGQDKHKLPVCALGRAVTARSACSSSPRGGKPCRGSTKGSRRGLAASAAWHVTGRAIMSRTYRGWRLHLLGAQLLGTLPCLGFGDDGSESPGRHHHQAHCRGGMPCSYAYRHDYVEGTSYGMALASSHIQKPRLHLTSASKGWVQGSAAHVLPIVALAGAHPPPSRVWWHWCKHQHEPLRRRKVFKQECRGSGRR